MAAHLVWNAHRYSYKRDDNSEKSGKEECFDVESKAKKDLSFDVQREHKQEEVCNIQEDEEIQFVPTDAEEICKFGNKMLCEIRTLK